jgi:hypothetical protein
LRQEEQKTMRTPSDIEIRELDRRAGDGFDVRLLWHPETNRVSVAVEDELYGGLFALEVDPGDALVAFRDPFAYASRDLSGRALAA